MQGRGQEVIDYARERGLALRDDSILVQGGANAYLSAGMAQPFWPEVPVILESEHYGGSRDRGNWQDGSKYLEAVEQYHASYASIHWWPREFLSECRPLIDRINARLGYRLHAVEVSWPVRVRMGAAFRLTAAWRNVGVAPCLPGGFPAVTLKDAKGGIAGLFVDESFDVGALPVAPPGEATPEFHEATFALPFSLKPGAYDLFISVGTRTGTPRIALPLQGDDGQRRYRLGTFRVTGDYDARFGPLARKGDGWLLPVEWTINQALPAGVSPFLHFEREGQIAFQGGPEAEAPKQDLQKPGAVSLGFAFSVPEQARGQEFTAKAGLWIPERIGTAEERLIPDRGELDRRVTVGTLKVGQDGAVSLVPAP